MNYKHAAGRNWTHDAHRPRPAQLHKLRLPEAGGWGPTLLDQLRSERRSPAGRNWAHRRPKRRPVSLRGAAAPRTPLDYPARERGGGDHDQPYDYHRPSWRSTAPFTLREYARLLLLRSRLRDQQPWGSALQPQRQAGHEEQDLVGRRRHRLVGRAEQVAELSSQPARRHQAQPDLLADDDQLEASFRPQRQ